MAAAAAAAGPAERQQQQGQQESAAAEVGEWALGVAAGLRLPRAVGVHAAVLCCAARDADPNASSSAEGWAGAAVWFSGKLDNRPRELADVVRVIAALRGRRGTRTAPEEGADDLVAEVLYCERRVLRTWCTAPPPCPYAEIAGSAAAPAAAALAAELLPHVAAAAPQLLAADPRQAALGCLAVACAARRLPLEPRAAAPTTAEAVAGVLRGRLAPGPSDPAAPAGAAAAELRVRRCGSRKRARSPGEAHSPVAAH
eukprot:TRINITY_DN26370_c0_g1_i2.p2 TRINITY_DN26370_c0_g1~~TRINITY_DN26370_c0_g1_i2.p2  ORF type:complete len:285 (+),score=72.67 TRINITY_DN26370_c0_g1_i2:88-855(+)